MRAPSVKTSKWCALGVAAAALLAGGCASGMGEGDRIVVEVRASKDLNAAGGTPQPVLFRVVAMKNAVKGEELAQWDAAKLATVGTVIGGETWVWPEKTVSLPPLTASESGQYAFVGISVAYPAPRGRVVALGSGSSEVYTYRDGQHRITFLLGKDSIGP